MVRTPLVLPALATTALAQPKSPLVEAKPFGWPAYDALSPRDRWSITAEAYTA